jgi:hypothetical protein
MGARLLGIDGGKMDRGDRFVSNMRLVIACDSI